MPEILHAVPGYGRDRTPCCQQSIFDLPLGERMTLDPKKVTCGKPVPVDFSTDDGTHTFPELDTVDVAGRIVVIRLPATEDIPHETAEQFGDAVKAAGGVAVLFLSEGWDLEAVPREEIERMLDEIDERVSPEGPATNPSEDPMERETKQENEPDETKGTETDDDTQSTPVDSGSVPNTVTEDNGRETDYGAQQRTGDPDAQSGTTE